MQSKNASLIGLVVVDVGLEEIEYVIIGDSHLQARESNSIYKYHLCGLAR